MKFILNRVQMLALSLMTATSLVMATEIQSPYTPTTYDFGGIGLIQMPNGRSAADGEFSAGFTINNDYRHYHTSLQVMPWFETTIRYTQTPDLLYSGDPNFSGDTEYTDKGVDLKFRLWQESFWLPETAIGFRDLAGTGLFDGEYIAASKRFGDFDVTLGVGWGYIGNRGNLKGNKSNPDCGRGSNYKGRGGSLDYERWFTGCMSVFGGVEYQTPWKPLVIKVEYDANDYKGDFVAVRLPHEMEQDSPVNVGMIYRLKDWGYLRANYERGNTWTLGFTLKTNFNTLKQNWVDTPTPAYQPTPSTSAEDIQWQQVSKELERIAGYDDNQIYADNDDIYVVGTQSKYRDQNIAIEKAALILKNTGSQAARYHLIEQQASIPVLQTNIDVQAYTAVAEQQYVDASITDAIQRENPQPVQAPLQADNHQALHYGLTPVLQQSIGGSEDFYLFNVGINGGASYWLTDHITIGGGIYLNLYDNYDQFLYDVPPDGTDLKRVRTLVRQYISDSPLRLSNLQLTSFHQLGDDVYLQNYGGYLETMFAGVGSEILYRTLNSNWAWGLDVNYVAQRDPDNTFSVFTEEVQYDPITNRHYRVQTGALTGHLTAYYRPEWTWFDNLLFKVSVGQYLAEDRGVTVDLSKQFDSGVVAGAYFAKTDLSAEEFGEGSFTKGVYVSIPFDLFTIKPSANRAVIAWTPLTRDGGQMLARKYHLYRVTEARDPKAEFTPAQ